MTMKLNLKLINQHWHEVRGSTRTIPIIALCLGAAGLLGACGNKPPGCSDSAVKETLIGVVLQQAAGTGNSPPLAAYFKDLKVQVSNVTTGGYDEGARRHECQATISFADPHDSTSLPIRYTVQGMEDAGGKFQVAYYETGYPIRTQVLVKAVNYLREYASETKPAIEASMAETPASPTVAPTEREQPQPAVPASVPTELAAPPAQVLPVADATVDHAAPHSSSAPLNATPSFPCSGKLSASEQLICDTPALADADAKLSRLYAQVAAKTDDLAGLKRQQRDWIRVRDACADATCMQASYAKRTSELMR
jgi:uncharacterized protein YecT (DUF1311 family)